MEHFREWGRCVLKRCHEELKGCICIEFAWLAALPYISKCFLVLSGFWKAKGFKQLSKSKELPCGTVLYLCHPVLFCLFSEWERMRIVWKERCSFDINGFHNYLRFKPLCILSLSCENHVSLKCHWGFLKKHWKQTAQTKIKKVKATCLIRN